MTDQIIGLLLDRIVSLSGVRTREEDRSRALEREVISRGEVLERQDGELRRANEKVAALENHRTAREQVLADVRKERDKLSLALSDFCRAGEAIVKFFGRRKNTNPVQAELATFEAALRKAAAADEIPF